MEIKVNILPTLIREWRVSHDAVIRTNQDLDELKGRNSKFDMWKLEPARYNARLTYLTEERNRLLIRNFSLGEKIALANEKALQAIPNEVDTVFNKMMDIAFPSRL